MLYTNNMYKTYTWKICHIQIKCIKHILQNMLYTNNMYITYTPKYVIYK